MLTNFTSSEISKCSMCQENHTHKTSLNRHISLHHKIWCSICQKFILPSKGKHNCKKVKMDTTVSFYLRRKITYWIIIQWKTLDYISQENKVLLSSTNGGRVETANSDAIQFKNEFEYIYHQHTKASYKMRLMVFLEGIGQQYVTIFAKK